MFPVTDALKAAVRAPFQVRVQVSLIRAGSVVMADLPVVGGSVSVDSNSWVRRTLSLSVPPVVKTGDYTEARTRDFILTKSDELRVRWGVVFTDGSIEWIPLGIFRVDDIPYSLPESGPVRVKGVDRCADVADAVFLQPLTFQAGSTTALITQLIQEVSSGFSVYDRRVRSRDARVPPTQVDGSRSDFIQALAAGIGAVVYVNGDGDFVIVDAPRLTDMPVMRVEAGRGGNLVSASGTTKREGVFNCAVVRGESPSGDFAPVQATVMDTAASSPTRYGDRLTGAFGKVPRIFDLPNVTTLDQARAAAYAKLGQYAGQLTPLNVAAIPMPFLEPGDTILVDPEKRPAGVGARAVVVDSWSMDLAPGGEFSLVGRDIREVLNESA